MTTRNDTPIDLLLRDAFAQETSARANSTTIDATAHPPVASVDPHLDVDELSALTATTLPEATRATYLKHLVTCDACRRQASLLALAAASETATVNQSDNPKTLVAPDTTDEGASGIDAPRDFWKSFTPPFNLAPLSVATYTLAALVVLTLGIGLFVHLNNQNSSGEIAMQTVSTPEADADRSNYAMSDQSPDDIASATNATTANIANGNAMIMNGNTGSGASGLSAAKANSNINSASDAPQNPGATKLVTTNQQIIDLPINGRNANALVMLAPSSTPAPALPQADLSTSGNATVTADAAAPAPPARLEPQDSRLTNSNNTAREVRQDTAREADEVISSAQAQKNEEQGFLRRTEPNARASSNDTAEKKKASSSTSSAAPRARSVTSNETVRVIGNRRFTRQAEAWIDSSYRTSMRVTNIKRDSEKLRALITQDSAVRLVIEQLAGSLIIVVNNEAYRVQ